MDDRRRRPRGGDGAAGRSLVAAQAPRSPGPGEAVGKLHLPLPARMSLPSLDFARMFDNDLEPCSAIPTTSASPTW
jgi:hypothetical protein